MKAIYDLELLYIYIYMYTYIVEYILVTYIYVGLYVWLYFYTDEGVHFVCIIFIRLDAGKFLF